MALIDKYRKYMYGTPGMERPVQGMSEPTQGLFGVGGEIGGGLLQENLNQMNTGQGGLLSNIPQSILLGSALYGEGLKGRDPFEGFFPAVTRSAQLQTLMAGKRTELSKNLIEAGFTPGTAEYQEAMKSYLTKDKKFTLSDEVLNVYNKLKGKTGEEFDAALDGLSDAERTLYNNKIAGNPDLLDQLVMNKMETLNTPIVLEPNFDKNKLEKNQLYQNPSGEIARWDGEKFVIQQ